MCDVLFITARSEELTIPRPGLEVEGAANTLTTRDIYVFKSHYYSCFVLAPTHTTQAACGGRIYLTLSDACGSERGLRFTVWLLCVNGTTGSEAEMYRGIIGCGNPGWVTQTPAEVQSRVAAGPQRQESGRELGI